LRAVTNDGYNCDINKTTPNMSHHAAMKDIYARLKKIGFDANFLRRAVLPDWWEDSLATVAANRAMAEAAIARHLGLQISCLRDATAVIAFPALANARLKRSKNITRADVAPAMLVAQHAAEIVAKNLRDLPKFSGALSASDVRKTMLHDHAHVDFKSLIDFCWSHGIPVIHVKTLPKHTKKMHGMALFCGATPVIVLASKRDSPPWLAFHLAHELGHILLGHVKEGMEPLVDANIDSTADDPEETQADEFACEILTGQKKFQFAPTPNLTAPMLAAAVRAYGKKHGIAAGVATLIYGRSVQDWPLAQTALKHLNEDTGAHAMVDTALSEHTTSSDMSESSSRFLIVLSEAA
jgi:hypothetical protein